ncbi:MAG: hypothetical protein ACRD2L_01085 [Terriglobia bacterium]
MLGLGDTLMMPKPGQDSEHLWVLITNPERAEGKTLMVNLTTKRSHSDTTLVLQFGEHPFITRPTVVLYADARVVEVRNLEAALQQGTVRFHQPVSMELLQRVQSGLLASPFTPPKAKDFFQRVTE